MRNALRTFIVGLMVVALTFNPAMACHFCGGGYGNYSYQTVHYGSGCGGCGGCEVVHDECGDCGDCGSCDGCDSCGGEVGESSESEPQPEPAPAPPAQLPAEMRPELPATQPEQPATVERPVDVAPVEPALPPQVAPEETTVPPAEDLFNGTDTATPSAEVPATETPAEPADDLFSPPAEEPADTTPAAPAETPATDESTDDLFGGTESTETTPAATDTDPAATDAPTETPAEAPVEGETPAEEESDDIFGARNVLHEEGGLASNEMRMWVDNTGSYSVNGRLVRFIDGHVRLMKENGRTTTVPLNRLSERDLQFVNRQASAQKATTLQTAQVTSVSN